MHGMVSSQHPAVCTGLDLFDAVWSLKAHYRSGWLLQK